MNNYTIVDTKMARSLLGEAGRLRKKLYALRRRYATPAKPAMPSAITPRVPGSGAASSVVPLNPKAAPPVPPYPTTAVPTPVVVLILIEILFAAAPFV